MKDKHRKTVTIHPGSLKPTPEEVEARRKCEESIKGALQLQARALRSIGRRGRRRHSR